MFDVHGMTCSGCTGSVQRTLSQIVGDGHPDVLLRPGTATLKADTSRVTPGQIEAAISSLGYQSKLLQTEPKLVKLQRHFQGSTEKGQSNARLGHALQQDSRRCRKT